MALNRTLVDAEETTVANHVFEKKCGGKQQLCEKLPII